MLVTRQIRRLLYTLVSLLVCAQLTHAAPVAKTLISDTVYRADGSPAAGTLVISWPAFTSAGGKAVAAGSMTVPIGAAGAVSLELIPTQGAVPSGTYYRVTTKLDDGTSSTEFWAVPTLSPITLSAIRSTVIPAGVAVQVVSREYVDGAFVRKTADENVGGVKTFEASPLVPTPSADLAAANKLYVDASVAANGNTILPINKGGTGAGSFTASKCVRVSDDGSRLEADDADCSAPDAMVHAQDACNIPADGSDAVPALAACESAHPNQTILFPPGTYRFAGDHTTPAGTVIEAEAGTHFTVDAEKTLTITGTLRAPITAHLFAGAGKVVLRGNDTLYPQWFGAIGDGVADDHDAFDHCINWSPVAHCLAIKTQVPSGQNIPDYFLGSTLTITNSGAVLEGNRSSAWDYATYLKFPVMTTPGIHVAAAGVTLKHIDVRGMGGWHNLDITTYDFPNGNHGIVMGGARGRLDDIAVYNFDGHCIVAGGNAVAGGWADDTWQFYGTLTQGCRGFGIFTGEAQTNPAVFACSPSDSSAGTSISHLAYFNQMGGIGECSRFGNTYIGAHFDSNARVSTYRGYGTGWGIGSVSRTDNLVSISLDGLYRLNQLATGDVLRITATETALDNTDCIVASVPDFQHFTCTDSGADVSAVARGVVDWARSTVSSASRTNNVVTVVSSTAVVNLTLHTWVYFHGTGTALDDHVCHVTAVTDATHFTCAQIGADVASATSGNVAVASTLDVLNYYETVNGNWKPGAFYATAGVLIQPYCEQNQLPGYVTSMMIGPTNCTPSLGMVKIQNFTGILPAGVDAPMFPGASWLFRNYSEGDTTLACQSGLTTDAACNFGVRDKNGALTYLFGPLSGGPAGFPTWGMYDVKNGYWPLRAGAGGSTMLSSGATGNVIVEGAGALTVNNASGLRIEHNGLKASIDNDGVATVSKLVGITDTGVVTNLNADKLRGKTDTDFAQSNQACSTGQFVTGVSASGVVTCATGGGAGGGGQTLTIVTGTAISISQYQSLGEVLVPYNRVAIDLTNYTQFRVQLNTSSSGWNSNTTFRAYYKTGGCTGLTSSFSPLEGTGTTADIKNIPAQSVNVGAWASLTSPARADACVMVGVFNGGDSTAKNVNMLTLQFR